MSQRAKDLILLYVLALAVNGVVAALVSQPGYTDAYYYFNGGRFIAEGRGLVEPYRWNYVNAPAALPAPGFDFWQPLPAYLAALGIALFGGASAFDSAQAIYVIACAFLPVITYSVAAQLGERRHAMLAGLLAVFSGFYVIYWSLPESFTPYALAGGGALALMASASRTSKWWLWLLVGMCGALAHLSRADGLLVVTVGVFAAVINPSRRWLAAGSVLAGYLVIMAPWFIRNQMAFGSPMPPGGISALWLTEYNDLFNYPQDVTPARYFASGWEAILRVKWQALVTNSGRFLAEQNLIFLLPLTLVGAWRRWRDPGVLPAAIYQGGMFAAMTFAFSLPGMNGGYFHSAGALLPATFTMASLGLDDVLGWAAARRGWRLVDARRVFGPACVVLAVALTAYLVLGRVVGLPLAGDVAWNRSDAAYREVGEMLNELGVDSDAQVMSNNPPGFYYFTGHGGMPLPNGDEAMLLRAARDYHIAFVVVDRNVPTGLVSLYLDGPRSPDLALIETYGGGENTVYLYRIVDSQ